MGNEFPGWAGAKNFELQERERQDQKSNCQNQHQRSILAAAISKDGFERLSVRRHSRRATIGIESPLTKLPHHNIIGVHEQHWTQTSKLPRVVCDATTLINHTFVENTSFANDYFIPKAKEIKTPSILKRVTPEKRAKQKMATVQKSRFLENKNMVKLQ